MPLYHFGLCTLLYTTSTNNVIKIYLGAIMSISVEAILILGCVTLT